MLGGQEEQELSPYKGPLPFEQTAEDRDRFFGRNKENRQIFSLILSHAVVLTYGKSGTGKTSLFNAQLVPTLEKEGFDVLPVTRVQTVIPHDINTDNIKNLYVFNSLQYLAP